MTRSANAVHRITIQSIRHSAPAWTFATLLVVLAAAILPAHAGPDSADMALKKKERAACVNGQSSQDRVTCLKEAEAAYAVARQGKLGDATKDFARNARERCNVLTGDDQRDCLARVEGKGSSTGSVAGGGILTELVTQVPAPAVPASGSH